MSPDMQTVSATPTNMPVALPAALTPDNPAHLLHAGLLDDIRSSTEEHPILFAALDTRGIGVIAGKMEAEHVSDRHRHTHEAVMIIVEGEGRTVVEERTLAWKAGDVFVIPAWAWHQHFCGPERAVYVACDTLPMVRAFGLAAKQGDA